MSPLVITVLVLVGIALVIAIGYINHSVENRKLERARQKADLLDRSRRCSDISESMPGQFMSPALKLLLGRIELALGERLLAVDKQNTQIKERIAELRPLIAQGESIPVRNAPQPIVTEAKAKDVRFLFEALHAQITRCAQDGLLPRNEAQQWVKEIRHLLTLLHIEFFGNLGQQALQQGQPGQARLAFERGVQYLHKQQDAGRYQAQLQQLENQLARANAMVLENAQPVADENSALNEGLKALDDDDLWKKKNLYDD
ncbi:hypothetical protein LNN38_05805 [Pseudomonas sp. LA21]|uniref:hypothetical protein n=1 Tax=unclassified Pseudomonas TaxID=196821 RepID=UPI001FB78640|nr:hypothetical protein [Pseudomonas sp. LA21]